MSVILFSPQYVNNNAIIPIYGQNFKTGRPPKASLFQSTRNVDLYRHRFRDN